MNSVHATCTPINWPTDLQKYDIYINEKSMFELVFGSQQPKAKDFRRHCSNAMFLHIRKKLTNKLEEDHQQAITEIQDSISSGQRSCILPSQTVITK